MTKWQKGKFGGDCSEHNCAFAAAAGILVNHKGLPRYRFWQHHNSSIRLHVGQLSRVQSCRGSDDLVSFMKVDDSGSSSENPEVVESLWRIRNYRVPQYWSSTKSKSLSAGMCECRMIRPIEWPRNILQGECSNIIVHRNGSELISRIELAFLAGLSFKVKLDLFPFGSFLL